jgi:hypothetical protein
MKRIFAVDILECGRCQGRMRILAVIEQPEVIAKILTHLGLPARAPPPSPLPRDLLSAFDQEAAGEGFQLWPGPGCGERPAPVSRRVLAPARIAPAVAVAVPPGPAAPMFPRR